MDGKHSIMEQMNIMETKGVAGYEGLAKLMTTDLMLGEVEPSINRSFQSAFNLLDWFQCENVHRFRSGAAIRTEKYITKHLKRQAEDFIARLTMYEHAYEARMLFTPLPPVSLDTLPEVLSHEIMSYLLPIVRLENLRRKYTNEYLSNRLNKKTIPQLKYIHENYENVIYDIFEDESDYKSGMYGWVDMNQAMGQIYLHLMSHPQKPYKVAGIVQLYLVVENHLMNTLIRPDIYHKHCLLVIKLLHLLVIVCNQPQKRGCHETRIMRRVPHAV